MAGAPPPTDPLPPIASSAPTDAANLAPPPSWPGMAPMPAPAPLPPPPPRRRIWLVVVAIVIVVLVLVAVLALAGVFSPSSNSQGVTGAPIYYSQAASPGAATTQNESGGPWTLVAAEGVVLSASASGSNVAGSIGSGCNAAPAPGSPSSATIPATPTGSPAGAAAAWMFLAVSPSNSLLFVIVTQSSAFPLIVATGSCVSDYAKLSSIVGLTVVNSTVVANSANSAGGSAFLSSNSGALQLFGLFGPGLASYTYPVWAVEYNSCGLSTAGSGTQFLGVYDALDGTVLISPSPEATGC
jgi:hypothetical protein